MLNDRTSDLYRSNSRFKALSYFNITKEEVKREFISLCIRKWQQWQRDKLVGPTPSVAVASTRDIGRVGAGGRVKGLLLASKVAAGPAPPSHSRPSRGMRRVGALPATHSLTHHTHPLARARPPRGQRQPASACTHSVTRPIALELQIVAWLNTAC